MDDETEKYIVGSLGRYRKGGFSVSQKPVEHTSIEELKQELGRLRGMHPEVTFGAFKLPLTPPFTPMKLDHV